MAKQIEIEFEKGGKFIATLMEDKAPKTCKAVWDALPIESRIQHAKYSGEIIFLMTPPKLSTFDELENPLVMGLLPGDIAFNTLAKHHLPPPSSQEILIIYGGALPRDMCGWLPSNHFAKIVDGSLEELANVGKRVYEKGMEKVVIRKKL